MIISSLDNKFVKDLRKLKQKKYRDKTKSYLVEGPHLVKEAYKSGNLLKLILPEDNILDNNTLVDTIYIKKEILREISSLETPYNVFGLCKYQKEEKIGDRILILDDIQDPGNLGTIIRSSVAFNIDTIVLGKNCVDLYNSKVIRACQGMNFYINIIRRDLSEFILEIKKDGYKVFGTDVNNGTNIKNVRNPLKCAIIMGNEGNGVSKEIKQLCDDNIYIKMNNDCESLNVAVATSIILYEFNNLK